MSDKQPQSNQTPPMEDRLSPPAKSGKEAAVASSSSKKSSESEKKSSSGREKFRVLGRVSLAEEKLSKKSDKVEPDLLALPVAVGSGRKSV